MKAPAMLTSRALPAVLLPVNRTSASATPLEIVAFPAVLVLKKAIPLPPRLLLLLMIMALAAVLDPTNSTRPPPLFVIVALPAVLLFRNTTTALLLLTIVALPAVLF